MPTRRLALQRETLTALDSDELASVAGAISVPHPLCNLIYYTQYPSCGFGCTSQCPPPSDTY